MSQYGPQHDPTRQYGSQGGYPQQPYGQQPYGQQQPPRQNPFGTEGNDQFGIAGVVCSLLGAILIIVCLTSLEWFNISGASITFGDISDRTDEQFTGGFASAYFSWFAWTFLFISVVAAIGGSFPSPALRAARVVGVVAAFATAGLSFLAVQVTTNRSYVDWLADARIGFYLAVVGFILIGVGAGIGPRKV